MFIFSLQANIYLSKWRANSHFPVGNQMGFKTPGTASCEWLSVLVKMPQEAREKIELSVETEAIDVRSPRWERNPAIYQAIPYELSFDFQSGISLTILWVHKSQSIKPLSWFSRYRLHLKTPHSVDPNASSAKWHSDTSTLEIILRLVRELDNVNF